MKGQEHPEAAPTALSLGQHAQFTADTTYLSFGFKDPVTTELTYLLLGPTIKFTTESTLSSSLKDTSPLQPESAHLLT